MLHLWRFAPLPSAPVYGYDEIFPHLLNLVTEKRQYDSSTSTGSSFVGITKVKATLNSIRTNIGKK